jgi:hypothetical protein
MGDATKMPGYDSVRSMRFVATESWQPNLGSFIKCEVVKSHPTSMECVLPPLSVAIADGSAFSVGVSIFSQGQLTSAASTEDGVTFADGSSGNALLGLRAVLYLRSFTHEVNPNVQASAEAFSAFFDDPANMESLSTPSAHLGPAGRNCPSCTGPPSLHSKFVPGVPIVALDDGLFGAQPFSVAEDYSVQFSGYFSPDGSGNWEWWLHADDFGLLWIGEQGETVHQLLARRSGANALLNANWANGEQGPVGKAMLQGSSYPVVCVLGEVQGWDFLKLSFRRLGSGQMSGGGVKTTDGWGLFSPQQVAPVRSLGGLDNATRLNATDAQATPAVLSVDLLGPAVAGTVSDELYVQSSLQYISASSVPHRRPPH